MVDARAAQRRIEAVDCPDLGERLVHRHDGVGVHDGLAVELGGTGEPRVGEGGRVGLGHGRLLPPLGGVR